MPIILGTDTLSFPDGLPPGAEVSVQLELRLSVLPPPPPPPAFPTPAGYWKFDDNLLDSSGNGRDLTGSVVYDTGKFGQCVSAGAPSRSPQEALTANLAGDFTISCWANSTQTGPGSVVGGLRFGTGAPRVYLTIDEAKAYFQMTDNDFSPFISLTSSSGFLVPGWNHLLARVTAGTAELWLNGSLGDSSAGAGALVGIGPVLLTVKCDQARTDDAAVWNVALSDAHIAAIAAGIGPLSALL